MRGLLDRLKGRLKRLRLKEVALRLSYQRGLPPGLGEDRAAELLGAPRVVASRFRRMSGWKRAGAYRVVLRPQGGRSTSLVYKDARYFEAEMPALRDLPVSPGRGEYAVYADVARRADSELLPEVLLAEELEPGRHYRYVLRDLGVDHHTCVGDGERAVACAALPRLHRLLAEYSSDVERAEPLRFDREFDRQLLPYARDALAELDERGKDPRVERLLERWDEVAERCEEGSERAHAIQPLVLVHGDYNTSNVLLGKGGVKVVDWEWTGWGLPHADLATMLDGASPATEERCVAEASASWGLGTLREDRRVYLHACLQRALFHASFAARQVVRGEAPPWFPGFASAACGAALRTAQRVPPARE